jgi:deoxyribodipyrimidine photo-lyase
MSQFPVNYSDILSLIDAVDPIAYGKSRNFVNGAVTRLSPYISRGVISTKQVYERLLAKGYQKEIMVTLIRELAWRDFFQQVARVKDVLTDVRNVQEKVASSLLPEAIMNATTGVESLDNAINGLYKNGYVHNHQRMYLASVICNVAQTSWKQPAQWMYYHLLDGDIASNHLSWQWVCGCFSSKKYYANQENVNHYSGTNQHRTFLDVSYEEFPALSIPDVLKSRVELQLTTPLSTSFEVKTDPILPTLIYNYYNLDPQWYANEKANRILLLEPSVFAKFPVSANCIDFCLAISNNIEGLQIFVGDFSDLQQHANGSPIIFKEHPLNKHYKGVEESRDWLVPEVNGYFSSFFNYWKQVSVKMAVSDHERKAH